MGGQLFASFSRGDRKSASFPSLCLWLIASFLLAIPCIPAGSSELQEQKGQPRHLWVVPGNGTGSLEWMGSDLTCTKSGLSPAGNIWMTSFFEVVVVNWRHYFTGGWKEGLQVARTAEILISKDVPRIKNRWEKQKKENGKKISAALQRENLSARRVFHKMPTSLENDAFLWWSETPSSHIKPF